MLTEIRAADDRLALTTAHLERFFARLDTVAYLVERVGSTSTI